MRSQGDKTGNVATTEKALIRSEVCKMWIKSGRKRESEEIRSSDAENGAGSVVEMKRSGLRSIEKVRSVGMRA